MCPPPCGPRRARRSKQAITKNDVEEVILSGNYQCFFQREGEKEILPYEGCVNNLCLILYDGETTVKVANRRSRHFLDGYRTIIMKAPCFPAVIVIREESM